LSASLWWSGLRPLSERGLSVRTDGHHIVVSGGRKLVVLGLKPYKLSLEITDPLLQTSHLRDHPGVGTTDVAK
jgi:hypothetical protein